MASPDEPSAESPLESPSPPTSPEDEASSPTVTSPSFPGFSSHAALNNAAAPSTVSNMTTSSQPLGNLNTARGKPPPPRPSAGAGGLNPDIMAKMKAFSISRQQSGGGVQSPGPSVAGFPSNMKLPPQLNRPSLASPVNSAPAVPKVGGGGVGGAGGKGLSLAERRGGMKLPGGGLPGSPASPSGPTAAGGAPPPGRQKPKMTLSQMRGGPAGAAGANGGNDQGGPGGQQQESKEQSQMERYKEFVDTKTGALTFKGKAVIHGQGVDFASGRSFSISLDEVDTVDELGKGNYGTVYKVRHARPRFRRPGQGLAGNKARDGSGVGGGVEDEQPPMSPARAETRTGGPTGMVMAMKEMRLELEDAKFQTIIMELDVLHRCISPYIVDFYGAFFQEGAVYICMEFMDGGSVDKIYGDGIPENVLRKITLGTTLGLKSLKEEHNIIHRDVKPTNILVNTRGQVKICDFGVSGNLVASIAKTKIGCQSYMAPERISSGNNNSSNNPAGLQEGTYSVQSDIWSLGLSIIECAMGRYPYPPETYDNIFSQLSAIVDGAPPDLPADSFSPAAHDFVAGCLNKIPNLRPTYPMLLQHPWLAQIAKPTTIVEEDEEAAERAAEAEAAAAVAAAETQAGAASTTAEQPAMAEPTPLPTESIPATALPDSQARLAGFVDREVGEWVLDALDRRKRGVMGKAAKPALHTAPLDAMESAAAASTGGAGVVVVDA